MPKLKTNRGATKRFRRTANGGYKHKSAYRNHILTKKSTKRKRHLRPNPSLHKSDIRSVARMLNDRT